MPKHTSVYNSLIRTLRQTNANLHSVAEYVKVLELRLEDQIPDDANKELICPNCCGKKIILKNDLSSVYYCWHCGFTDAVDHFFGQPRDYLERRYHQLFCALSVFANDNRYYSYIVNIDPKIYAQVCNAIDIPDTIPTMHKDKNNGT